jgi:hypothetical protein
MRGDRKNVWERLLPILFLLLAAASRWPGLLPPSFSAVYALAFCAGVYASGGTAWWLPMGTLLLTDIALDCYYYFYLGYHVFGLPALKYQLVNYAGYLVLIWLGRRFKPRSSFLRLLSGGILGALLFYLLTNTASWFLNPFGAPEYTRTLVGWITALTKGTAGWPETWRFFINTLTSAGLFTGLFVGAMKLSEAAESAREKQTAEDEDQAPEPEEAEGEAASGA